MRERAVGVCSRRCAPHPAAALGTRRFLCVFENDLVDTSFITPPLRMRALWLSLRSQLPALLEDICTCKATPIEEPPPAVPTSEGEGDAAAALLGLAREGLGPLPPQPALACLSCGTAAALVCSRCHVARYCNSACQRSHWVVVHSQECKAGPPPSPTPGTTVSRRNDAYCSLLVVDRWALALWLYRMATKSLVPIL